MRKLETVLGADDDPDVCAAICASLRSIVGLEVRMTGSGEHLIELALERPPDLVLLDVMMPGMDGPATLRRMRESALINEIPAIFITAKVMPADLRRVLPVGALGLISKPFDPLTLGDQIVALWSRGESAVAEADSPAQVPVEALAEKFLRRAAEDIVVLRASIQQACTGSASALEEIGHIAHKIQGSAAMVGFNSMSAIGEAIEHLAAGLIADAEAHGPLAESALVRQIAPCIEQLAAAVESGWHTASSRHSVHQEAGSRLASPRRESFRL